MKAKQNGKTESVIDNEKALEEKKIMQKQFVRGYGYPSYTLDLLIEHFEEEIRKENEWVKVKANPLKDVENAMETLGGEEQDDTGKNTKEN